MNLSRVELLHRLDIYEPTLVPIPETPYSKIKVNGNNQRSYSARAKSASLRTELHHFPCILLKDGAPWIEANRYLLSKSQSLASPNYRTLTSIARDLVHFRRWADTHEIDYLNISKRVMARPTYRYCSHLHDLIREETIKPSTAKRKICSLQGFYRWLKDDGLIFPYSLWRENDAYIRFSDSDGFSRTKKVARTDLSVSFNAPANTQSYETKINDGQKLTPLTINEQLALLDALQIVGNIEMTLAFHLALGTGGRLQTIFTLRQLHFAQPAQLKQKRVQILVGGRSLVSTKNSKPMVIEVPARLYERVRVYLQSERYLARLGRACNVYESENDQYAFLTRMGRPYYMSQTDPFWSHYFMPPRGNAITQFIRQQLRPVLESAGTVFCFRFHDLRATFGTNLLRAINQLYGGLTHRDPNNPDYFRILMYVRERMGHSSLKTTERYLNYRADRSMSEQVQDRYEEFLENIVSEISPIHDLD